VQIVFFVISGIAFVFNCLMTLTILRDGDEDDPVMNTLGTIGFGGGALICAIHMFGSITHK
jgi:hypothetical protein